MTGNSLDAVDVVLTEFAPGSIKDLAACTLEYPRKMTDALLKLRELIRANDDEMEKFRDNPFFVKTVNAYSELVAQAVNRLITENTIDKAEIAAVGFHGQTCGHFPPSIAKGEPAYTLQIGNAQLLADLTGIPVIYDFRSDDIMNGGEGAPLAPVHNLHISGDLREKGVFPVAFCNAGNTGNIAVITENENSKPVVMGWDVGPFNHFADYLARTFKNEPCDRDARYGKCGRIISELLQKLFNEAAVNNAGDNFYLQTPPKSSDPSWYRITDALSCREYSFEDTIRTVEYLSVYSFFHSLSHLPENLKMPSSFLVFGGGWKNPLAMADFRNIAAGKSYVMEEHHSLFDTVRCRMNKEPVIEWSDKYGYSGKYMEARIFADMAYCKIVNEPFSYPETTGCKSPAVAGIWAKPHSGETPELWNRAAKGWQRRINFH